MAPIIVPVVAPIPNELKVELNINCLTRQPCWLELPWAETSVIPALACSNLTASRNNIEGIFQFKNNVTHLIYIYSLKF